MILSITQNVANSVSNVEIFSEEQTIVFSRKIKGNGRLNISSLKNGTYTLRIYNSFNVLTNKFIKR